MDKEQLKKWHGVIDWGRPANKKVLSRRPFHIQFAKTMDRFLKPVMWLVVYFGFLVIALPEFIPSWKEFVSETFPLSSYYYLFVNRDGTMSSGVWFVVLFLIARFAHVVFRKHLPGGGGSERELLKLSYRDIISMELYPRTIAEEFFFYFGLFIGVTASLAFSYVFGVIVVNFL